MKLAGKQVAAARELLGLSQTDLATMAGIARPSISKFEAGRGELRLATLTKIQAELERRGIEFINGRGMGVRLNYDKAAEFARTPTPARGESDR
jgi:transcriptional regulator with XRE-family HTH domain